MLSVLHMHHSTSKERFSNAILIVWSAGFCVWKDVFSTVFIGVKNEPNFKGTERMIPILIFSQAVSVYSIPCKWCHEGKYLLGF